MEWLVHTFTATTITPVSDILLGLMVASLCGAAIGFDREVRERAAGLRTHMLTGLAAAIFTILTFEIMAQLHKTGIQTSDPLRVIEAVTAGVAFLAAGAIIQAGPGVVKGLTTGAGMWTTGALGVASGAGYYLIAIIGALFAITILTLVRKFERYILETKSDSADEQESSSDKE